MSKLEAENADSMIEQTEHSENAKHEANRAEEAMDFATSPAIDAADPLNWSQKKKILNLSMVAFHGMMASITAAAIQSAFVDIAKDLHVSVQKASYLTSLVIAILGAAPLLWRPLSDRFGRQPVFMLSLLCSLLGNVGCALSGSYSLMAFCRAISAFFISPAIALGSAVVSEIFFQKERARYMGVWASMCTLGVFIAPLLFGFAALRVSYRWIYWVLAIVNGVQFLCYLSFGSESRYVPLANRTAIANMSLLGRYRKDPTPLKIRHFIEPLMLITRPCIALPSIAYSMTFLWATVSNTFEMPQIFPERYGFNTQQVGLQNIAFIIGNIMGEQIGGIMSDKWMSKKGRKGARPAPEYRLWLSYIGYALACCGLVVFYVQIDRSGEEWNVTPMVGGAITTAGNQVITTILITYAVDCHPEDSSGIGVFVNFVRQIWGFIGPFWFPQLIEAIGLSGTAGVAVGMIVGVSVVLTVLLQWQSGAWRFTVQDKAA